MLGDAVKDEAPSEPVAALFEPLELDQLIPAEVSNEPFEPPSTTLPMRPTTCGLHGCMLSRLHSGMCQVDLSASDQRKRKVAKIYDAAPAPPPRVLYAAARAAGKIPAKKHPPQKTQKCKRVRKPAADASDAALVRQGSGGSSHAAADGYAIGKDARGDERDRHAAPLDVVSDGKPSAAPAAAPVIAAGLRRLPLEEAKVNEPSTKRRRRKRAAACDGDGSKQPRHSSTRAPKGELTRDHGRSNQRGAG